MQNSIMVLKGCLSKPSLTNIPLMFYFGLWRDFGFVFTTKSNQTHGYLQGSSMEISLKYQHGNMCMLNILICWYNNVCISWDKTCGSSERQREREREATKYAWNSSVLLDMSDVLIQLMCLVCALFWNVQTILDRRTLVTSLEVVSRIIRVLNPQPGVDTGVCSIQHPNLLAFQQVENSNSGGFKRKVHLLSQSSYSWWSMTTCFIL